MVLFSSGSYSDAILAFSKFIEVYPDHPLAGNAQYYVGESYFKQKEYRLAIEEFDRVLTSYDRSSHVASTLLRMSQAEEELKKPEDAKKHKMALVSLFPQSTEAAQIDYSKEEALPKTPTKAEEKTE
jgi:tol-pal system protein YbgF